MHSRPARTSDLLRPTPAYWDSTASFGHIGTESDKKCICRPASRLIQQVGRQPVPCKQNSSNHELAYMDTLAIQRYASIT
jgi:hypothetical protein